MKKLFWLQPVVLLAGSIFAWYTVYTDFARFYGLYQSFTRIQNCVIPNPITTPCFYGAFAFVAAFIWAVIIQKLPRAKQAVQQSRLVLLLIGSTIFAWSNLAIEIYNYYFKAQGDKISCSGVATDNIFTTPCFIGSMIFLISLVISLIIRRKNE